MKARGREFEVPSEVHFELRKTIARQKEKKITVSELKKTQISPVRTIDRMGFSDYNYMGSEAKNHACSNSQSQKKAVNFVWIREMGSC